MNFQIQASRSLRHVVRMAMSLTSVSLLLTACGAPSTTTRSQTAATALTGPKTLRLGWDREPLTLYAGSGGNTREYRDLFSAGLTYLDAAGSVQPKLAQKIPSITNGD